MMVNSPIKNFSTIFKNSRITSTRKECFQIQQLKIKMNPPKCKRSYRVLILNSPIKNYSTIFKHSRFTSKRREIKALLVRPKLLGKEQPPRLHRIRLQELMGKEQPPRLHRIRLQELTGKEQPPRLHRIRLQELLGREEVLHQL